MITLVAFEKLLSCSVMSNIQYGNRELGINVLLVPQTLLSFLVMTVDVVFWVTDGSTCSLYVVSCGQMVFGSAKLSMGFLLPSE